MLMPRGVPTYLHHDLRINRENGDIARNPRSFAASTDGSTAVDDKNPIVTMNAPSPARRPRARRRARVAARRGAARQRRTGSTCRSSPAASGLHQNTVRWHLGVLADAGVVESAPAPRSAPRPAAHPLRAPRRAPTAPARDEHRLLATILAGTAGRSWRTAQRRAEQAGRAWGRYLVRAPAAARAALARRRRSPRSTGLLDEQGFAPEARRDEIQMHRCPFHDLAESSPEIVCAVHRGLLSGALRGARQRARRSTGSTCSSSRTSASPASPTARTTRPSAPSSRAACAGPA